MIEYCKVLTRMLLLLLCFLAYHSGFASGGELRCIENEREALLEFKKGFIDEGGVLSSWGSEEDKKDCCQWERIKCSHETGHVIALQLGICELSLPIQLRGKISSALLELNHLSHLDLSCNDFGDVEIPDFIGSMEKLQYLNFQFSKFSGVVRHQLMNLTNLRTLNLRTNNLGNELVFDNLHWLSRLSSLSLLDLSYNYLEDANSLQDILNLPSLKELYLSGCHFPTYFSFNSSSTSLSVLDLSYIGLTSSSFHWLFNISTSLRSIDLSDNHLEANIPSDFGRFTFLEHLDLSWNQLTNGIPESLGNLSHLHTLDLSGNQLTGRIPISWGNLSHLQTLSLSYNSLSESLPELFYKLSVGAKQSLEILELQGNNLYGSLPDFTLLSSLRILLLQENQLNGNFPRDFAHISSLDVLDLSTNKITGLLPDLRAFILLRELNLGGNKLKLLPTSLGQLSMLEKLDVSSISGTISEIHLSKLHNLKELDMSFNSLAFNVSDDWNPPFQLNVIKLSMCNMGPRFPIWLRTQTNLFELDLSGNGISEEVPKWFGDFSPKIGYLNLSHNQIIGDIPNLSPINYSILDISCNKFSGPLQLSFSSSFVFLLSDNMFVGSISSICTKSDETNILDLSNNQFSGELPDCWENSTHMEILNLSNNKFFGNIPHSLGSLLVLKILQLRNNNFSGELPSTLMNCSMLEMFDVGRNNLRGNIPAWIGTRLTSLKVLSFAHNNFSGHIPIEICYLTEVQVLDFSRNFVSGKLPQCFNNFTSLTQKNSTFDSRITGFGYVDFLADVFIDNVFVQWKRQQAKYGKTIVGFLKLIDLSSNRLVGDIPSEISQLRAIISLNLSRNYLSGSIIPNISQMEMLESLDLSRNNFSGEIPKGLAKLHFLTVLDLSNNHLSGKIPSSTQLQSFEPSAYASNSGLCGRPLTSCPGDDPNPSTTHHGKQENIADEEDDGFIAQLHSHEFYITMILGFIVGFWGAVGTLVLKNSWRYAFFNFFDRIGDWLYVTATINAGRLKRSLRTNVPN